MDILSSISSMSSYTASKITTFHLDYKWYKAHGPSWSVHPYQNNLAVQG